MGQFQFLNKFLPRFLLPLVVACTCLKLFKLLGSTSKKKIIIKFRYCISKQEIILDNYQGTTRIRIEILENKSPRSQFSPPMMAANI